jgi:hypothetical protein
MIGIRLAYRGHRLMAMGAVGAVFLVLGCGEENTVTTIESSDIVLSEATAKVNDQSLDGQTLRVGQNENGNIRFEARLVDHNANPAPNHQVRVEYEMPGMGMMHRRGTFMLYDDGTHGDPVPHDGFYCYEDMTGDYGCHGSESQPGEYHYDFCGIRSDGHETNHVNLMVKLVP